MDHGSAAFPDDMDVVTLGGCVMVRFKIWPVAGVLAIALGSAHPTLAQTAQRDGIADLLKKFEGAPAAK